MVKMEITDENEPEEIMGQGITVITSAFKANALIIGHVVSMALLLLAAIQLEQFIPGDNGVPYGFGISIGIVVNFAYIHSITKGVFVPALRRGKPNTKFVAFMSFYWLSLVFGSFFYEKGIETVYYSVGVLIAVGLIHLNDKAMIAFTKYIFRNQLGKNDHIADLKILGYEDV
jgi:hypothetical protein